MEEGVKGRFKLIGAQQASDQKHTAMYAFKVGGLEVGLATVILTGGGVTVFTVLGYRLLTRRQRYVSAG
jgi:hypothetical protein